MIKKILYTLSLLIACMGQSQNIFANNEQLENTQNNATLTDTERRIDAINRTFDTVLINGIKVCFFGQCIGYKILKDVGYYFLHDFGTHFGNILFPYVIVECLAGVILFATPPLPVLLYWLKNSPPNT